MKLIQFQILNAIEKHGTFSGAAHDLFLSQSSVSIYIKALEDELGYGVVERTNRGVLFTERGKLVLEQSKIIACAVDEINNISLVTREKLLGKVRVGALPHIHNTILADLKSELELSNPDFSLIIDGLDSQMVIAGLERGDYDLGIVQLCDLDQTDFQRKQDRGLLRCGKLATDRLWFCTGENNPLLKKDKVVFDDLVDYEFLSHTSYPHPLAVKLFAERGLTLKNICKDSLIQARRYLNETNTFTLMPGLALSHSNMNYAYKLVPFEVEGMALTTTVMWAHSSEPLKPAEKLLVERIASEYSSYPGAANL